MQIQLGSTVRDVITGYRGVVIGRTTYLTGCDQYLVKPRELDKDGKIHDGAWLDAQRLVVDDTVPVLSMDNGNTPGGDVSAPLK